LHLSEIARSLDLETNHAKYHLLLLEKHGLIASRKDDDGYWRFWPKTEGHLGTHETLGTDAKTTLALLRNPLPLHITLLLLSDEELNHAELVARTGAAHGTVHYHLRKMEKQGTVTSTKEGRERRYRLTQPDMVHRLLLEHRPPDRLVAGFLAAWEAISI
jgi:predicted transcriptional regulator